MSIAVVTGASSGIGQKLTELLTQYFKVDEVWAIARREDRLKQLSAGSVPVRAVALDLANTQSFEELGRLLKAENKQVGLLINCAGYGKFGSYKDFGNEAALGMIDLNCRALVGVTNTVLPFMPNGAKILQICSISAFQPLPDANVYAASKVFVLNYSRALYWELRSRSITVTALCPGWVDTDFFKTATATKSPNAVNNYTFMQTPERVARQGLQAAKKGRMLSIVGKQNKLLYIAGRLLPVKFIMRVWMKTKTKKG